MRRHVSGAAQTAEVKADAMGATAGLTWTATIGAKRVLTTQRIARDVIVIGASAGGVAALMALCKRLPADLLAAVFIVIDIGANESRLPELLLSTMTKGRRWLSLVARLS